MIPRINRKVLETARAVWNQAIDDYGREISLHNADNTLIANGVRALCKRPKILGLFDRTEQSYDQTKYMVMLKADAVEDPEKFMRARWDNEDHVFISVTKVDLIGVVFGYRILVKG